MKTLPTPRVTSYDRYTTVVGGELKTYHHVYVDEMGQFLPGITKMLTSVRNPEKADEFKAIPPYILYKAAARGHVVHELCQSYDMTGEYKLDPATRKVIDGVVYLNENGMDFSIDMADAMEDAQHYLSMRVDMGLSPVAMEYCVSNGVFASCIDCVHWSEDLQGYVLFDIKTTREYHDDDVRDQLNIYRMWFEQTTGEKVVGMYGIHLCQRLQTWGAHEVEVLPDEEVEAILELMKWNYLHDESEYKTWRGVYGGPLVAAPDQLMSTAKVEALYDMLVMLDEAKKRSEELKAALKTAMEMANITSWDAGRFKATISKPSTRKTFDSKAFQKDHPDLYEQYVKESAPSTSFKVTLR